MTVLNYEHYTNVTTHHDALAKIKTFADSEGWTIAEWQANKEWADQGGGTYGWSAGTESFLAIQSAGYGAQTLHYRFRTRTDSGDANHEFLECGAVLSGDVAIDTSATHPVQQNNIKSDSLASWKPATIPELWIFGNDRQLIVFARFDDRFTQCFWCGTSELFDSAEDEGGYISHSQTNSAAKWYDYTTTPTDFICPFDNYDSMIYDAEIKASGAYACEVMSTITNQISGGFSVLTRALQNNNYSGSRVVIKPKQFVKRTSDGLFFPIGNMPVYRLYHPGLSVGQQIEYGSDVFLAFPGILLLDRYYGVAVKIA